MFLCLKLRDICHKTTKQTFKYKYIFSIYMINARQEQLVRKVTKVGNGAHIFAPKEWLGEEVIIIRHSIKDKIFSLLGQNLMHIKGVYLYGSNARGEAESGSDIDLLLIADRKIKIKADNYEIISLKEEDIKKAINISPVLMYSILSEAKPIINAPLLETFRKEYQPKFHDFKKYLEETKNLSKAHKDLIKEKKNLIGVAYSLILRLKGIYIINCLISEKKYLNKEFEFWLKKELPNVNLDLIIKAYKSIKRDKKSHLILNCEELSKVLGLLDRELKRLHEKKKKT